MTRLDTEDRWLLGMCWFLAAFSVMAVVVGDIGGVIGVVGMTWLAVSLHREMRR